MMSPTGGKNKANRKKSAAAEITETANVRAFTPEVSVDENTPAFRTDRPGNKSKR
jgi:hypothetical protein